MVIELVPTPHRYLYCKSRVVNFDCNSSRRVSILRAGCCLRYILLTMGEVSLRISKTAGPDCERGTLLHITDAMCGFGKVIRLSKPAIRELVQSTA